MNNLIELISNTGFKQIAENVFELNLPINNFSTNTNLKIFLYKKNNKFYFCDNGDIVEEFDCVNINTDKALIKIENKLKEYNCYLIESKITKEVNLNNFEKDLTSFIYSIIEVDLIYKNI